MSTLRRKVWTGLSLVAAAVAALTTLACESGVTERAPKPLRPPDPPQAKRADPPAAAAADEDTSLAGVSRRVARFVQAGVARYGARLAQHGLAPPTRLELALQVGDVAPCARKAVLASRLRDALAAELSRLDGLALADGPAKQAQDGITLAVALTTHFDTVFRAIQCSVTMDLGGERRTHLDAFDSEGLVCVRCPINTVLAQTDLVVSATRNGFAADFPVEANRWFLLPAGPYDRIVVRAKVSEEIADDSLGYFGERTWQVPSRAGIQNVWDLAPPPPAEPAEATQQPTPSRKEPAAERQRASSNAAPKIAQLLITSPKADERLERVISVTGTAAGLEGASVRVTVVADAPYEQDHTGVVRDGVWDVPGCILGRVSDRGGRFLIQAVAHPADGGQAVESPLIPVSRQ